MSLLVEGLRAGYGAADALHGVSLSVAEGECVLLLGRNGAGKSTTLKAIMGVVRPRAGRVLWRGEAVTGWPAHRVARAGIGWVPEERRVFPGLTVAENLEAGRRPGGAGREWALELFPPLAPLLPRLAGRLSGGEQQMLSLARTLMGGPRLLLLDEPAEGLAPVVLDRLEEALRRLRGEGLSLLLSEQNLAFADPLGDRAVVLERGVVVHEGPMAALRADPALRERLLSV